MKLTPEQLQAVRAFVRKRGFNTIDVQLEIIDHVACRIEAKLTEKPELGFEQALHETHAEFGVHGFAPLEDAIVVSLERQYRHQAWLEGKRWLSFPAVMLVMGFSALLYQLFFLVPTPILFGATAFAYLVVAVGVYGYHFMLQRRYRNTMAMRVASSFMLFPTISLQLSILFNEAVEPHAGYAFAFVAAVLLFTYLFACAHRIARYALRKCKSLDGQLQLTQGGEQ